MLAAAFPSLGLGFVGVSLAFGLTVLTMAYSIGHISGCHLNPAVTIGLWSGRRFPGREILPYGVAQVLGAISNADGNVGGQTVNIGPQAAVVRGVGLIHTMDDIRNTMIAPNNGKPVLVRDIAQVGKLFSTIGPRYSTRAGGYIRVLKAGFRHGDNAAMAVIEFVDRDVSAKGKDSGPVQEMSAE